MTVEQVKSEIVKLIRRNSCQFQKGSNLITVTEVTDVSLTIREINADNPALENYEFQGSARLSIPDKNGTLTENKRIKGTAKVKDTKPLNVQIKNPISIY